MGYEIDFLPVGNASSGGDAIALRYGNLHGSRSEQTIIIIDGGYASTGEALVQHVRRFYNAEYADLVVSTHPDQDHIGGLQVVLEELALPGHTQLLMHRPNRHADNTSLLRKANSDVEIAKSLQGSAILEVLAMNRNIEICEPFSGVMTNDGVFTIVGPSEAYYEALLANIRPIDVTERTVIALKKALSELVRKRLIEETFDVETLSDNGTTSPQNNTSVISILKIDGECALLTADAGIPALEGAIEVLGTSGIEAGDLDFVQVPHHGSKNNVGPSVLDQLLGEKGAIARRGIAFASVPPDNPDGVHPAKTVTNAFRRRGYEVHVTAGATKWYRYHAPAREGFIASEPVPFHDLVEAPDE